MKKKIQLLFIPLMIIAVFGLSYGEVLDRIVAVVHDQIILQSELLSQFQLLSAQGAFKGYTSFEKQQAKEDLLKQMIEEKLILLIAQADTSISVSKAEIRDALERHIEAVKSRFPSEESFINQLAQEGLSLKDLRERYRDEVKNQLLKERLLNKQLSSTTVNNQEVKDFFEEYRDSLPERPASIKLAHILFYVHPSEYTLDTQRAKAESLLTRIKGGESFSDMAMVYSDDPTSRKGGDLGFFGRGDMVPEFERAAFSLSPGELSPVIKTDFGFHLIKCEEREGERIRCRHILFATRPSAADSTRVMAKADSVYALIQNGMSFEEAAKQFSEDTESNVFGGELGWYVQEEMNEEFKQAALNAEVGEVVPPLVSSSGIHILKILDKQPERPVSLELDWEDLQEFARREKANKQLEELIEQAWNRYHVDIREISG
ncbi:MAG: hypothetical protein GF307_07705 [candidate division Zixibacteria bacterium]|nr:hypothetical protein [candidate division Zixibacteria bacterium]